MICVSRAASSGFAQNRQQHSGTVLLHLHRRGENVERAFVEQPVHHVAEDLRIQVVEIGLKHARWSPANRFRRIRPATSPMVKRTTFAMTGEVARAGAVAGLLNRHRRKRCESFGQRLHDRGAGRRDQFHLNAGRINRRALQAIPPSPEPAPERRHARTSPCPADVQAGNKQCHRHAKASAPTAAADDVHHRVDRADLVKVDFFDVAVVDPGLRRAQSLEDGNRGVLRALADALPCG